VNNQQLPNGYWLISYAVAPNAPLLPGLTEVARALEAVESTCAIVSHAETPIFTFGLLGEVFFSKPLIIMLYYGNLSTSFVVENLQQRLLNMIYCSVSGQSHVWRVQDGVGSGILATVP
jgi:hypothetical protein